MRLYWCTTRVIMHTHTHTNIYNTSTYINVLLGAAGGRLIVTVVGGLGQGVPRNSLRAAPLALRCWARPPGFILFYCCFISLYKNTMCSSQNIWEIQKKQQGDENNPPPSSHNPEVTVVKLWLYLLSGLFKVHCLHGSNHMVDI